jgi:drug/metabolite transporter (DMT)-like permease
MALGASVTLAGYLVIGRRARRELSVATYAGVVYGIGGVLIGLFAVAAGASLLTFSQRDALVWLALVLAPTLAGHTVFNWALRYVSAAVVGVAMLGEPVVTTILAWVLLGESPGRAALIGGAAILAGVYLALRGSEEPGRVEPTVARPAASRD